MQPATYETPGTLHVELRIPAGTIRARAENTATTQLDLQGERADEATVELRPFSGGHKLVISAPEKRGFSFKGWELDVDLVVPIGTIVDAETGSADVDATGVLGGLSIRSGSGDLDFETVTGDVVAKVASGDVHGGEVGGSLTVHGASGDVSVRRVAGDITCRTASGDVTVEELGAGGQVTGVSGDIDVGAATTGSLKLRSVSGDIAVGVAPGTGVWLDLTSASGDAVSELAEPDGPSGEATLEIHASSVSGDIRIASAKAGV
ncbi:MAG TPA: DUF4097 family beta strand repeat-containing protein [Actinomycetota bacterium]|jgi:DUF4097 and DUF4098 domain-containing protein YvlB|nr:DUF4097 family beta strand repeat-containing protein [Actinomycetota bacterium]